MATYIPSGGSNPNLKDAIGTISTQAPPTFFNKPEFRTKIVHILSQTANGCLKELDYHPQMAQEASELKSRIDYYRGENNKLYDDNRQLLSMVRDAQNKLGTYSKTINQLELQVAALHKTNQDILMRERNLAVGNPAYNQLHSEYMHLSGYCVQLKQQIEALQRMIFEKPALQHVPVPVQQPFVPAEGGQLLPIKQSATRSTPGATRKTPEHLHRAQSQPSHISVPSQDRQSQEVDSLPSVLRSSVVTRPRPPNQPYISNDAPQIQESAPSQPATHSSDVTRIGASEAVGSQSPRIMGWMNKPSPYAAKTHLRVQNPSPSVASFHREQSVSAQLYSSSSSSTAGSIVAQISRNRPTLLTMRPPDVNAPPGMNFVPIGPPGKLLPPLTASVVKQPSPPSRPPSTRAPSPTRTVHPPESSPAVGVVIPPPLDTGAHIVDHSRTPNLTPTSSRNSVAPSEGELEATTPLDDHVNHIVKVVELPINEVGVENSVMVLEGAPTASSLKRSSLDIQDDEDGNSSDIGESARKRLKMSEGLPSKRDEDDKTIPTNSSLQVLDENTGDEEEEDEFGPDGKRCIEYCLAVFTEEDGDVTICSLCRLRQESGLISAPTIFSPDTIQDAKVQHFLDEHPTAWENMINGRNCS